MVGLKKTIQYRYDSREHRRALILSSAGIGMVYNGGQALERAYSLLNVNDTHFSLGRRTR